MKKKIFIAIILIAIIVIGGIFIIKNRKDKFDYKIEKVDQYNYYIYKEENQCGVIDKSGKTIIDAKYTNVIIPNPDKDIFVCYSNNNTEILNSNNEKLYTEYEKVEPIKLKNVASTLTYEKGTLSYKKDGLYGLIDFSGKQITKNIYSSIENLQPTEGKFIVSKEGKYGVIDKNGNTLVETKYDKITSDGYYTKEDEYKKSGFIVLNKTDDGYKYGYISNTGKNILDAEYNEIERISKEQDKDIYLIVSENGKFGLYKNSKKIIENEYQSITNDNEEVLILKKNKKYGAANLDGKIIIDVENDAIEAKGMYLYVEKSNDKKVYDTKGKVTDIDYNKSIYQTENEKYKISTIQEQNITYYGVIDKNGKQLVKEKYRYIEYVFGDYFIATDENGNIGIINSGDKTILEMKYNSLQKVKGKNILQAISSEASTTEFYSSNMEKKLEVSNPTVSVQEDYIIVTNDDQKTYLDKDGNIIKDSSKLKAINYPSEIGEYKKQQITIETVYYIKK